MENTIKLYDQDGYATEFTASVMTCEQIEEGKYEIILNQTLFFPEEGGQSPDTGFIDGQEVVDVQIKNDVITHTMTAPLEVGSVVTGKIDWTHRFSHMQQHTGEHIYSGLVHNRFGYNNVGFHLSDQVVTMDFDGVLTADDVNEIEKQANQVIVDNIDVQASFPSKEELKDMDYRSKIEIDGQVRLITIPGVDVCACCAPHVKKTGEVGMLKVMSCQNYKGGVRLSILCGFRALDSFCQKAEIVTKLGSLLSSKEEEILATVTRLKEGQQSLKAELAGSRQEIMEIKLSQLSKDEENVVLFESEVDNGVMRNTVNQLVEQHTGIAGIFSGDDIEGYRYILGSKNVDMKELATQMREQLGSKGGGSNVMIQGLVQATQEEIRKCLNI